MLLAQGWSVALTIVGAAIEVLGIIIAVVEIVHRGTLLGRFRTLEQQRSGRSASTLPAIQTEGAGPGGPAGAPTVEDRLNAIEAQMAGVPAQITAAAGAAEANARKHADDRVRDAREDHDRDVSRLRDLLVGSVDGNRRAILGVSALFLGLVLQAAGSVVGTLGTSC